MPQEWWRWPNGSVKEETMAKIHQHLRMDKEKEPREKEIGIIQETVPPVNKDKSGNE